MYSKIDLAVNYGFEIIPAWPHFRFSLDIIASDSLVIPRHHPLQICVYSQMDSWGTHPSSFFVYPAFYKWFLTFFFNVQTRRFLLFYRHFRQSVFHTDENLLHRNYQNDCCSIWTINTIHIFIWLLAFPFADGVMSRSSHKEGKFMIAIHQGIAKNIFLHVVHDCRS